MLDDFFNAEVSTKVLDEDTVRGVARETCDFGDSESGQSSSVGGGERSRLCNTGVVIDDVSPCDSCESLGETRAAVIGGSA